MADLILHHYPASPFSEKIRLLLGAKRLPWRSVIIPRIMPKPDVVALTGGYRKTPILQIGADIYCDSALIAKRIDAVSGARSLFPERNAASIFATAQWADSVLFGVAVRHVFQPANLAHIFGNDPSELEAFTRDRQAMRANATTRRLSELEAHATTNAFLRDLDKQLAQGGKFVCGESLSIADFSVYHCLWFLRRAPESAKIVQPFDHVLSWMQRIADIGHGQFTELASTDAVEIARNSAPVQPERPTDAGPISVGDQVEVLPTDYGIDPSAGTLVTCDVDEFVIRRMDPRAGEVFVHFPRINYELRKRGA